MNEIALVYALWVIGGGSVNSGYLVTAPQPVAYFATDEDCEFTRKALPERPSIWYRCIGARYVKPK